MAVCSKSINTNTFLKCYADHVDVVGEGRYDGKTSGSFHAGSHYQNCDDNFISTFARRTLALPGISSERMQQRGRFFYASLVKICLYAFQSSKFAIGSRLSAVSDISCTAGTSVFCSFDLTVN